MGPVYKVIDSRTNTVEQNLLLENQYERAASKSVSNSVGNYIIVKQTKVIRSRDVLLNEFNVPALETISESSRSPPPMTHASRRSRAKRYYPPKSDIIKRTRTKKLKTDSMALHQALGSEGEESNSPNMMLYGEEISSPFSTDLSSNNYPLSTRSSISSDHDYICSAESRTIGLEPIQFDSPYLNDPNPRPFLQIKEQPAEMFRFRYISEMNGMHGSILGKSTNPEKSRKKTYPTVKLNNYSKKAIILCTLIQNDENVLNFHPHCLSLRGDNDQANVEDPLQRIVGPENGHTITYQGLAIVHTAKKKVGMELLRKREQIYNMNNSTLTKQQVNELKIVSEELASNVNMNSVRFLFVAYDAETRRQLCNPVYSDAVYNLKCAETGALKISRMSKCSGSVLGGDEVFMFVEKVSKKNIKIRFYELDGDTKIWEECARFSENDVHHQYGIVFTTPPYKDRNIQSNKKVYVELYRPKDHATSEPKHFEYKATAFNHKRRRKAENSHSVLSSIESNTSINSIGQFNTEIPTVISIVDKQRAVPEPMNEFAGDVHISLDLIDDLVVNSPINSLEFRNYNYSLDDDPILKSNPLLSQTSRIMTDGVLSSKQADAHVSIQPTNCEQLEQSSEQASEESSLSDNNLLYSKAETLIVSKVLQEMNSLPKSVSTEAAKLAQKITEWRLSDGNCLQHVLVSTEQHKHFDVFVQMVEIFDLSPCLNYGNASGDTALHTAVIFYKHEFVGKLLLAGSNPNILNDEGDSPLHLAVKEDNKECMVQLLSKSNYTTNSPYSLDVDIPNAEGWTALHLAATRGALASVSRLLCANADPNIKGKDNGRSALHLAVAGGHLTLVNYLIDNPNVQIDAEGDGGETPLHLACTSDVLSASSICESLLNAGADATKIYRNSSPIDLAKRSGVLEIYNVFKKKFPIIFKEPFIKKEMEDYTNVPSPSCEISLQYDESSPESSQSQTGNMDFEIKEETKDYLFMDSKTSNIVAKSLEESGLWKDLAIRLGYSDFVSIQTSSNLSNPSSVLLNLMEVQEKVSLKELQEALQNLNLADAANAVKAIIK